jgi:hypothetical protein
MQSAHASLRLSVVSAIVAVFWLLLGARLEMAFAGSPDNTLFTQVLSENVKNGLVNYRAIKADKRFADYIALLQNTDPETIPANERLAFWINAYNAFTMKIVVDQYPIKSIMSKTAYAFGKSNFQKKLTTINGKAYSLNDIENNIIRPYGDPRIHFAINCAAISCPPLRAEAYEPSRLSEQMDEQSRNFLNNPEKNSFDFVKNQAKLSKIFDWFKDDFNKYTTSVIDFISRYLPPEQEQKLRSAGKSLKINHHDYNWDLNDAATSGT